MIVTKSLIQNRRTGQLLQRNEAGFWMADEERIPCLGRSSLEYSIKISQRIENVDYCNCMVYLCDQLLCLNETETILSMLMKISLHNLLETI